MKKLGWIVGAAVLVAIAFFIPGTAGYIWTPVTSGMIVAGLFLAGLVIYIFRNSRSRLYQGVAIGLLAVLAASVVYSGIYQYNSSTWFDDNLQDIRKTIEKGIMLVHMQEPLLKTLKEYHNREGTQTSVSSLFQKRYGDNLEKRDGGLRFIPAGQRDNADEPPYLYLKETAGKDSVILVGHSGFVDGWDPEFNNFNGLKGQMQYKAILTKEGVSYEKEN